MQKSFLLVSRFVSQRPCRSSAIPTSNTPRHHTRSPNRSESSRVESSRVESSRMKEGGSGWIKLVRKEVESYEFSLLIRESALVNGKEERTCVFRYDFSTSHPPTYIHQLVPTRDIDMRSSARIRELMGAYRRCVHLFVPGTIVKKYER